MSKNKLMLIVLSIILLAIMGIFTSTKYYTETEYTQCLINNTWTEPITGLSALIDETCINNPSKKTTITKHYWEKNSQQFNRLQYIMKKENGINFKSIITFSIILLILFILKDEIKKILNL